MWDSPPACVQGLDCSNALISKQEIESSGKDHPAGCRYQGHVSAALVLGGVDFKGPHLFTVPFLRNTLCLTCNIAPPCTSGAAACSTAATGV